MNCFCVLHKFQLIHMMLHNVSCKRKMQETKGDEYIFYNRFENASSKRAKLAVKSSQIVSPRPSLLWQPKSLLSKHLAWEGKTRSGVVLNGPEYSSSSISSLFKHSGWLSNNRCQHQQKIANPIVFVSVRCVESNLALELVLVWNIHLP